MRNLLTSTSLPLIAASNIYDGIFHKKFELFIFKCLLLCRHHATCKHKQIVENGFPACKNSQIFEAPAAMESKDWEDLKKLKRFPTQF